MKVINNKDKVAMKMGKMSGSKGKEDAIAIKDSLMYAKLNSKKNGDNDTVAKKTSPLAFKR